MAKTLYFRLTYASTHRGNNDAKLNGTASWWYPFSLMDVRGGGTSPLTVASVLGPTNGIEVTYSGAVPVEFLSEPLSADFTISGTITLNLWAFEASMNDNMAVNAVIERMDGATGALTQIAKTARVAEVAISTPGVNNFTVTPTSTAMKRGDRLRVRVFADDVGTMAAAGSMTFKCDGNVASADGDSWIQFTENLTFEPAGDPGAVALDQTTATSQLFVGDVIARTAYAQSFAKGGTLTEVRIWLSKTGTPSDDLILEIQNDNAGAPSGTVVGTVATITGGSLTTTATQYTRACSIPVGAGTYWLVARRSGAIDASNSFFVQRGTSDANFTTLLRGDGTGWAVVAGSAFTVRLAFIGSTYYLTGTDETAISGAAVEKKALSTRGSSTVNSYTTTAAGPTAGIQIRDGTSGTGTAIEWYTPPLGAITFGGKAKFSMKILELTSAANASVKCEIAICDGDGSGAIVWGTGLMEPGTTNGELGAGLGDGIPGPTAWVAGDDTAITEGQRLRFRIYAEDYALGPLVAGDQVRLYYNGPTPLVGGDTYVILPVAVTESGPGPKVITPATVSNSQNVSGEIDALRRITPTTTVTNTNSVGGAVTKPPVYKPIAPSGGSIYSSVVLADNPKAYYRLGASPLTDLSGNNNTLTALGSPTSAASLLAADAADGSRDFASQMYYAPDAIPLHLSFPLTLEAWVRPDSVTGLRHILRKDDASAGGRTEYLLAVWDGNIAYYYDDGAIRAASTTGAPISVGNTYHIVVTDDGTNVRHYINGALYQTVTRPTAGATIDTSTPFTIGARYNAGAGTEFWDGRIDEVAIYNTTLSASKIAKHYQTGISAYTNRILSLTPKAYWCLGASPLIDISGNDNTLTVQGTAPTSAASLLPSDTVDTSRDFAGGAYTAPDSASLAYSTGRSIEAWINGDAYVSGFDKNIVVKANSFIFRVNSGPTGNFHFYYYDASWRGPYGAAAAIVAGTMYHLVAVDTGSRIQTYINGALVQDSARATGGSFNDTSVVCVGAISGPTQPFDGRIDEVVIHSYALSAAEVLLNYQIGMGTAAGGGITNTQNVSGAVSKQTFVAEPIVPAGITNSQSVSGAIRALKRVVPATVSNNQSVGGSLRVGRGIRPTTVVTNNQTVSGEIVELAAVKPTTVLNTQSVSGAIGRRVRITPTTVATFTNNVSGSIQKFVPFKPIVPAGVTNTNNVSGFLRRARPITPSGGGYSNRIISLAPLSYWRLGESAGTTAVDAMGLHNGTYMNAPTLGVASLLTGDADTAVQFDNTQVESVMIGNHTEYQIGTLTLEAWIKTSSPGASYRSVVVKQTAYSIFLVDGVFQVYDWTASATSSGVNVADGVRHHIAFVMRSGVANGSQMYIDGLPVGSAFTYTIASQAQNLMIASNDAAGQELSGIVDEVAVYGYALSNAQILANYNVGTGTGGGGVTNIQSVSGAVSKTTLVPKPIVPGGINNSQNVSGSIKALKRVTPSTVNNNQSVSGAIGRRRPITVAGITNNQSVSGEIVELAAVTPSGITNFNNVSGSVRALKRVTPTTVVTNNNSVAGAVTKPSTARPIVPTTVVTFTNNVSGAVRRLRPVVPTGTTFTNNVSGSLRVTRRIAPTTNVTFTNNVSGGIVRRYPIVAAGVTFTTTASGGIVKAGEFYPSQLTGLAIWFDASTLGLADGANVSSWPNLANGSLPGAMVGTPVPTMKASVSPSGKPVVRFKVSEGRLRMSSTGIDLNYTLVYVGRLWGTTPGRVVTSAYTPSNLLVGFWTSYQDVAYIEGFLTPDMRTAWTTDWKMYSLDAQGLIPVTFDDYKPRFFSDGVFLSGDHAAAGGWKGYFNISGYHPTDASETCDCEVAEVVMYNRKLSDVERIQVQDYLRAKWMTVPTKPIVSPTITNTQTVGGSIVKRVPITPATVNNSQNVVGTVKRLRPIVPAGITNTQNASGAVRRLRPIVPTGITNTQNVSGSVAKRFLVKPTTTVTFTNNVSGTFTTKPVKIVVPSGVTNSQNVSGVIRRLVRVAPTTITNTQNVTGSLVRRVAIRPTTTVTFTNTVAGSLIFIRSIRPTTTITNTQTVSGAIVKGPVKVVAPSTVTFTSTVAGSLKFVRAITPTTTVTNTQTFTGALRKLAAIRPTTTVTNTQTVTGAVRRRVAIKPTTTVTFTNLAAGSVQRGIAIRPATTVTFTNNVFGDVRALRRIQPSGITFTTQVYGSIFTVRSKISNKKLYPGKISHAHRGRSTIVGNSESIQLPMARGKIAIGDRGDIELGET